MIFWSLVKCALIKKNLCSLLQNEFVTLFKYKKVFFVLARYIEPHNSINSNKCDLSWLCLQSRELLVWTSVLLYVHVACVSVFKTSRVFLVADYNLLINSCFCYRIHQLWYSHPSVLGTASWWVHWHYIIYLHLRLSKQTLSCMLWESTV